MYIAINPGTSQEDLKKPDQIIDIMKFNKLMGISGMVYNDGGYKIISKPKNYYKFLSEIDNLTPVKF